MIEYSEIKKKIKIAKNTVETNDFAYLTHYLQNQQNGCAKYYREKSLKYSIIYSTDKSSSNQLISIKWDVPFPPPQHPKFTFIDLFAGIGGFRIALQQLGGKCVFTSEIDPSAKNTYEANFGEYPLSKYLFPMSELITKVKELMKRS